MPRKFKIFLDSSALISGLNSPSGGAGIILAFFMTGDILIYISDQVIEEVQRNIQKKFPLLQNGFINFLLARPKIAKQPTLTEVKSAYRLIQTSDAPILAAAVQVKPDFLITWDIKHFLKKEVTDIVPFVICTPEEFLQKYWHPKVA